MSKVWLEICPYCRHEHRNSISSRRTRRSVIVTSVLKKRCEQYPMCPCRAEASPADQPREEAQRDNNV
jgi:hypothetical protein